MVRLRVSAKVWVAKRRKTEAKAKSLGKEEFIAEKARIMEIIATFMP
jgi:hypothetical protein